MNVEQIIHRCQTHPLAQQASIELIGAAASELPLAEYQEAAMAHLRRLLAADCVGLVRGTRGRWVTQAVVGEPDEFPEALLGEVLDQDAAARQGAWIGAPLDPSSPKSEVLLVRETPNQPVDLGAVDACAAVLALVNSQRQRDEKNRRRVNRLATILDIAASWNQAREMDELLTHMAEASTKLLDAERASIFLWDKTNKVLVGRPALGVEGGELRIPDDTGIVGQVVRTGESRRVDRDIRSEQAQIDRDVDDSLGFKTETLLCVPLCGSDGQLFGAFEMINKHSGNFSDADEEALRELASHASVALENTQHVEHLASAKREMADEAARRVEFIGNCPAIDSLRKTIERVAPTDLSVLILGENGTGKDVAAHMIHYLSDRRDELLVAVNCAAISETLLESELFGHEKGAFTDAHETRQGKFELASGGTLFLDEIGDMSLNGQSKLLRVLEEKTVVRVGGSVPIATNARVFAATNQDLGALVRAKKFREDLFYRLNVVTVELPPLRERGDDVIVLAEHFLQTFSQRARRKVPKLSAAAKKRLTLHAWPGNVRELRNLMERLVYLSTEDKIDADDLSFILSPGADNFGEVDESTTLTEATRQFQVKLIKRSIDQSNGNMTTAAERLGLHRSNLYRKMRQLDMEV